MFGKKKPTSLNEDALRAERALLAPIAAQLDRVPELKAAAKVAREAEIAFRSSDAYNPRVDADGERATDLSRLTSEARAELQRVVDEGTVAQRRIAAIDAILEAPTVVRNAPERLKAIDKEQAALLVAAQKTAAAAAVVNSELVSANARRDEQLQRDAEDMLDRRERGEELPPMTVDDAEGEIQRLNATLVAARRRHRAHLDRIRGLQAEAAQLIEQLRGALALIGRVELEQLQAAFAAAAARPIAAMRLHGYHAARLEIVVAESDIESAHSELLSELPTVKIVSIEHVSETPVVDEPSSAATDASERAA